MLEAPDVPARLRLALALGEEAKQLRCARCGAAVASTSDAIRMTDEGTAGTFVNSYGW